MTGKGVGDMKCEKMFTIDPNRETQTKRANTQTLNDISSKSIL